MHILLFLLHVCVCCESDGNAGVGSGRGVVAVSACMSGTRGSGVLSSTGDVLEMSVVRGLVECVTCVCVWLGAVWVEKGVIG